MLIGVEKNELPPPLEEYQNTEFSKSGLESLITRIVAIYRRTGRLDFDVNRVIKAFSPWWDNYSSTVLSGLAKTFDDKGDWATVHTVQAASPIAGSPFEARHVFAIAKHSIDLIAQNHFFLTVKKFDETTKLLKEFLSRSSRRVTFVIMDPRDKKSISSWGRFMDRPYFANDLKGAIEGTFDEDGNRVTGGIRAWLKMSRNWKGKLKVYMRGLIPASQTFYDGGTKDGGLLMVPHYYETDPMVRPVLHIVRRNTTAIFDAYWHGYQQSILEGRAKQLTASTWLHP